MTLDMKHVLDDTGIDLFYETNTTGRSVSINADCLDALRMIPDQSVDMILCDLPYGTTSCKWDSVIPFEPLWKEYYRVTKSNAAIVLTASQPFTSTMVASNLKDFRYSLIWEKEQATDFMNMSKQFGKVHEDINVFYRKQPTYNPQMVFSGKKSQSGSKNTIATHNDFAAAQPKREGSTDRYPCSILKFNRDRTGHHPTQKPVALMEYLIRTYTNEGETVMDNTMGSGTTGVACVNTGRNFIGIERDPCYFAVAKDRIRSAYWSFCVEGFSEC